MNKQKKRRLPSFLKKLQVGPQFLVEQSKIEELFSLRQSAKHMRTNLEEDIMRAS